MDVEAKVRAAGYDLPDGYGDILHPSPAWAAEIAGLRARDRQVAALRAMRDLTKDDVRALLEALV